MAATLKRYPLQGVITIVRFNWHFHLVALTAIAGLLAAARWLPPAFTIPSLVMAGAAATITSVSLAATCYAYDASGLYTLDWLATALQGAGRAVNIHAGFDETSRLMKAKHPEIDWQVFDFHDPAKHTEISIKRARRAHPPEPGTRHITTSQVPLESHSLDRVVLMLAAHEIRNRSERVGFFRELHRILTDDGRVIVTEHLRDLPNIIAYTFGTWHFHPRSEWLATFEAAGLRIAAEIKNNLLITTFILEKNGSAP
jgi:SAM-dependent methyltransferase